MASGPRTARQGYGPRQVCLLACRRAWHRNVAPGARTTPYPRPFRWMCGGLPLDLAPRPKSATATSESPCIEISAGCRPRWTTRSHARVLHCVEQRRENPRDTLLVTHKRAGVLPCLLRREAVDDGGGALVQHGVETEARAAAQDGRGERGNAPPRRVALVSPALLNRGSRPDRVRDPGAGRLRASRAVPQGRAEGRFCRARAVNIAAGRQIFSYNTEPILYRS